MTLTCLFRSWPYFHEGNSWFSFFLSFIHRVVLTFHFWSLRFFSVRIVSRGCFIVNVMETLQRTRVIIFVGFENSCCENRRRLRTRSSNTHENPTNQFCGLWKCLLSVPKTFENTNLTTLSRETIVFISLINTFTEKVDSLTRRKGAR